MLRYFLESNSSVLITNDKDLNILQDRDPSTGEAFASREAIVKWATDYATELGETLIESDLPITEENELNKKINSLIADNEALKADNELLKGCVMELASIVYA